MNPNLKVSLRQMAVYVPESEMKSKFQGMNESTALLAANIAKLGFGLSERLLHALSYTNNEFQFQILEGIKEISGVNKNWTPLVKGWNRPTDESLIDHLITLFANVFKTNGTKLECGHIIPPNTFPLERYNGCPFCGTPFQFGEIENYQQNSIEKILDLWTTEDASGYLKDLLLSKTALDATQSESLKDLLMALPIPEVNIAMKETRMLVIDILVGQDRAKEASAFFDSPVDIMRYLWYKKTGFLQIIEPKNIILRKAKNSRHITPVLDKRISTKSVAANELKLKYNRKDCLMVAGWLNALVMDVDKMCEVMHPKRGMWVRFIRALRLAEYSKREGMEKLALLLDKFYRKDFVVFHGMVNQARMEGNEEIAIGLLKQRPGVFARSLFANMLRFGPENVTKNFSEIMDKIPARLVFTLNMYAENYFDKEINRPVKPLGGKSKLIPSNARLVNYTRNQREHMQMLIRNMSLDGMKRRFAKTANSARTIYIDPELYNIPISIGERSNTVQDLPGSALMGSRFKIAGNNVRLFMQWGEGMKAQHLDMDLSCRIAYPKSMETCSFSNLYVTGCKHSGDIRSIPDQIGTAEYIELDLDTLYNAGATYVSFVCNAYSAGSITPNLVLGWMNSAYPMKISETTGVAYDPSCVQHQVRIKNGLDKGLLFGVLDVVNREIIWLEMPFSGQLAQNLDFNHVQSLLKKLQSRLNLGQILEIKAEAQNLEKLTDVETAEEVYSTTWAMNTAAVTQLFVD